MTKLEERFDYSRLREFTVEAGRPDSITAEKLQVLRDHGISRISVNPQTMNQKTLDLIGRKHTVEQTKEAFFLARTLVFDNIISIRSRSFLICIKQSCCSFVRFPAGNEPAQYD